MAPLIVQKVMKIIIEVENREDFDTDIFMDWLNDQLTDNNMATGSTMWARLIGTEEEDDEND